MKDPRLGAIQAQTDVVENIAKEKQSYLEKLQEERDKAAALSENGAEEDLQQKQQEIVQETSAKLQECRESLMTALDDLIQVLGNAEDLEATEEFLKAQMLMMYTAAFATEY